MSGSETWHLSLREEGRHRMPEERELRRTFVPKREEVIGGWRKSYDKELRHV
jgi:hypothetical protein